MISMNQELSEELGEVELNKHKECSDKISQLFCDMNLSNSDEEILYKTLISEFNERNTNPNIVEYILKNIYDDVSAEGSYNWEYFETYLNDIYTEEITSDDDIDKLKKKVLLKYLNKVKTEKVSNDLIDILRDYESTSNYTFYMEDGVYIELNPKLKIVDLVRTLKEDEYHSTIINAYPQKIIVHDNPLTNILYSIYWVNKYSSRLYKSEKRTFDGLVSDLKDNGLVINNSRLKDTVSCVIQMGDKYQISEYRDGFEEEGFFYDEQNEKIISNYPLHPITTNELVESLNILTELSEYFKGSEKILGTCIKWGLVSAFAFARKQYGSSFLPYLFLYGKAGGGKTTIGKIILYLWSHPSIDNDLEGSSFNTEFRIGEQLMQSTLPLLVNEPGGLLKRRSVIEMLKSSVQSTVSRSKQQNDKFVKKPAYSPVVFASNLQLPKDEGLFRRFIPLPFTHNERKSKEAQKKFNKHFNIDNPKKSVLTKLHGLSNFCGHLVVDNPNLLTMDWDELGDYFIVQAFEYVDMDVPEWLLDYVIVETIDDSEQNDIAEIRNFLLNLINDKFNRKLQMKVYENEHDYMYSEKNLDDYYSNELATGDDFKDKVFFVINQHLIPFMFLNEKKNGGLFVNFNPLFINELSDNLEISSAVNLKSLSELLDWEYGRATVNKKSGTYMWVNFEKFIEFLYPNV